MVDTQFRSSQESEANSACRFSQEEELHDYLNTSYVELPRPSPETQNEAVYYLPGHPRMPLKEKQEIWTFLEKELWAADIESISPYLWIMSSHDSTSISALHRQEVEGRKIIITEEAHLHLVWHYDRIFIKPLPEYLLSHWFWTQHFLPEKG